MEGTTYLEHPALGVSLDSRLRKGMSRTEKLEQSVLGEGSIVRPETADMSERHHEQTCFKLLAWPTPVIDNVHNTDVNTDIDTDRPENSVPRNISDVNLFKCKVQDNREDRPMKWMTKSHQGDLPGFELAVADTDRELVGENQSYLKNTEETQFSYDTGLSSQELEDAIRREVLRNRLVGQVNVTDADISMDRLHSEGLRRWNTDMDIEYQYETFNGLPVYYGGDRYDSDESEEFFPNASGEMDNMMCNQRRPDGGDNNSVNRII